MQIKLMEEAKEHNEVPAQIKSERLGHLRSLYKVAHRALEDIEEKLNGFHQEEVKRSEREAHFSLDTFASFLHTQLHPRILPARSDSTKRSLSRLAAHLKAQLGEAEYRLQLMGVGALSCS